MNNLRHATHRELGELVYLYEQLTTAKPWVWRWFGSVMLFWESSPLHSPQVEVDRLNTAAMKLGLKIKDFEVGRFGRYRFLRVRFREMWQSEVRRLFC